MKPHHKTYFAVFSHLVLASIGFCFTPTWAANPIPLDAALHEEVIMVPIGSGFFGYKLETTIFKPEGNGPFPLIVINHGKAFGDPHFDPRARYLVASKQFVSRGYAVAIPMRRGFAGSGGAYVSGGCNLYSNGQAQADDVIGVLDYLTKLPFIDPQRILIAGQSHGGFTTMAVGSRNYPGVLGLLNFAGGLNLGDTPGCNWRATLTDAFVAYGKKTNVPSLWFYGDNDSYWGPDLPKEMFKQYVATGAKAQLISYGVFKTDAHKMFGSSDGVAIWWPETEKFLEKLGLPTKILFPLLLTQKPVKSNFVIASSMVDILPRQFPQCGHIAAYTASLLQDKIVDLQS